MVFIDESMFNKRPLASDTMSMRQLVSQVDIMLVVQEVLPGVSYLPIRLTDSCLVQVLKRISLMESSYIARFGMSCCLNIILILSQKA